ncbi:MAG: hypothetical protein LCI02_15310 [Proteobacteria bacterium]|nr:hypothetical protein [Pseudomonadota bacterium]
MSRWGVAAAGLGLLAYSLLSWALMAWAPDHAWTVLALFGPLLAGLALAGLQRRHRATLAGCAALALLLVWAWQRGGVDVNRLYVLQHAAIHALLAWTFAITLRPGAVPLVSAMAAHVHARPQSARERAYTDALTRAWALFFVAMIAVSLTIYLLAPWPWWSFFCTVLTPAAAVAGFVVEYAWRRWRHPEFQPVSVQRAIRAWKEQASR